MDTLSIQSAKGSVSSTSPSADRDSLNKSSPRLIRRSPGPSRSPTPTGACSDHDIIETMVAAVLVERDGATACASAVPEPGISTSSIATSRHSLKSSQCNLTKGAVDTEAGAMEASASALDVIHTEFHALEASEDSNASSISPDRRRWSVIDRTGRDLPGNFAEMRRQTVLALGRAGDTSPSTIHRRRSAVRMPSAGNPSDLLSRTTVRSSIKSSSSYGTMIGLTPSPSMNRSNTSQASLQSGGSNQSTKSAAKSDKTLSHTVVLCGGENVGKTALAIRFTKGYFEGTHTMCPVQYFHKHVQFDDIESHVTVVDISSKHLYSPDNDQFFRAADGFLVVFSVTDKASISAARDALKYIHKFRGDDTRILLCANKADCEKGMRLRDERALAAEFSVPLVEASQMNPRAGSPVYTLLKLIQYGPSMQLPTTGKDRQQVKRRPTETAIMERQRSSFEDSSNLETREILQAHVDVPMRELEYGERGTTLRKSASDSSMQFAKNMSNKAAKEKSPGLVKKVLFRSPFTKRASVKEKTNMTTMGPGLRRSVSDGDLTLDEVILRPRKKRSHLFVQSTLDEANNKEHSPLTAVKSQTSQLLPRDLLPVVSEDVVKREPSMPSMSSADGVQERQSSIEQNDGNSLIVDVGSLRSGTSELTVSSGEKADDESEEHPKSSSSSQDQHAQRPNPAVGAVKSPAPRKTVDDSHEVTCKTNDLSLYPNERVCTCAEIRKRREERKRRKARENGEVASPKRRSKIGQLFRSLTGSMKATGSA